MWARNSNPAAIGTAAGLPNEAEIRRNLAATTTSKQAELHDRQTGYQVLGGVDYAMSDAVSLGIKGRWVRFGRFAAEDIEWERLQGWSAVLEGERVVDLPESDQLRGTPILVTDRRGDAWTTTLKAVVSRSDTEIVVTNTGRPRR